jgi:hypothetical protein
MRIIKVSYNLTEKTCTIQKIGVLSGPNEVQIFMISENEITHFDNLSFGFVLKKNNDQTVLYEHHYPPTGMQYESADRSIMIVENIDLKCEIGYTIECYAENAGETITNNLGILISRPESPFSSWIWRGENWEPPIPAPTDRPAIWDDNNRMWIDPVSNDDL